MAPRRSKTATPLSPAIAAAVNEAEERASEIVSEAYRDLERANETIARMQKDHLSELYGVREEIKRLRAVVSHLEPRAEAFDALCTVLRITAPDRRGGGMGPDPLWQIEESIKHLEHALDISRKVDANG